jgi:hypothetical protein
MIKLWQVHLDATGYTSSVIWKVFLMSMCFFKKIVNQIFEGTVMFIGQMTQNTKKLHLLS